MDDETHDLFQELIEMVKEARWKIEALEQIIVDHNLATEETIALRIEDIKREEYRDLKAEARHRAFEKILRDRPKQ